MTAQRLERARRVIEGTVNQRPLRRPRPSATNRLMMEADTAIGPRERKPRKVPSPSGG